MKESSRLAGERKQVHDGVWLKAPSQLTLPANRIDVWRLHLDKPSPLDSADNLLSTDEKARASRFHFEKDRIHYMRCRCALRSLLSLYLAIPGGEIRFEYSASGKPRLASEQNSRGLQFNVSHSGGMALIAVGCGHQLGVDIEKIRHDVDTAALSERFFSLRERAALRALPDDLRIQAFFACWTRKESFLKATGDGLSFPLADFSVTTHPDLDPQIEEIKGDAEAGKRWFFADLAAGDGYRATVIYDSADCRLATYEWP